MGSAWREIEIDLQQRWVTASECLENIVSSIGINTTKRQNESMISMSFLLFPFGSKSCHGNECNEYDVLKPIGFLFFQTAEKKRS